MKSCPHCKNRKFTVQVQAIDRLAACQISPCIPKPSNAAFFMRHIYLNGEPVACGKAIKYFNENMEEINEDNHK